MEQTIEISQIKNIKSFSSEYSRFGEDYVFAHITPGNGMPSDISAANRFDGLTMILCLSGNIPMDINLSSYEIAANSLVIMGANDIMRINASDLGNIEAYTLFISSKFMRDINIDFNTVNPKRFSLNRRTPIVALTPDESSLLQRYWELLHLNTAKNTESIYVRSISRNLIASILYQMMQFASTRAEDTEDTERPRSRRVNYVYDFMHLVHKFHKQERSVGFYADKLFISPKYLSLIIKESTGRSAAEWIDEYVILEAKNLLRFSGKNVQQIAYELNFSNQSSFGKYFKHLTGMSPTEFQRS
ncbi:MAG: AraC family transcriptional regulator [Muribaculaceae bacterium]|nr:AraC family transcriptional regulator [Muribaculaceae bacterium]